MQMKQKVQFFYDTDTDDGHRLSQLLKVSKKKETLQKRFSTKTLSYGGKYDSENVEVHIIICRQQIARILHST